MLSIFRKDYYSSNFKSFVEVSLALFKGIKGDCLGTLKEIYYFINSSEIKGKELILILGDDDYGLFLNKKRFSQLIDSFQKNLISLKLESLIIRKWRSIYPISILKNQAPSNRLLFLIGFYLNFFKSYNSFNANTNGWIYTFKFYKPKLIVAIQPDIYLCRACKRLKIPVVDLQHGIIIPEKDTYYRYLNGIGKKEDFPDFIFSIFKSSHNKLIKKKSTCKIIYIGSPYLANKDFVNLKENVLVKKGGRETTNVLISHQTLRNMDYVDMFDKSWHKTGISLALLEAISKCDISINWIVRAHPTYNNSKELYRLFNKVSLKKGTSIEIVSANSIPLPQQLQEVDLHLTSFSSVVLEAAEYGIRSAVLFNSISIENIYGTSLDSRMITQIPNKSSSIINWLNQNLKKIKNKKFNIDVYQKEHKERILSAINKVN